MSTSNKRNQWWWNMGSEMVYAFRGSNPFGEQGVWLRAFKRPVGVFFGAALWPNRIAAGISPGAVRLIVEGRRWDTTLNPRGEGGSPLELLFNLPHEGNSDTHINIAAKRVKNDLVHLADKLYSMYCGEEPSRSARKARLTKEDVAECCAVLRSACYPISNWNYEAHQLFALPRSAHAEVCHEEENEKNFHVPYKDRAFVMMSFGRHMVAIKRGQDPVGDQFFDAVINGDNWDNAAAVYADRLEELFGNDLLQRQVTLALLRSGLSVQPLPWEFGL